jgi:hypothetical protein
MMKMEAEHAWKNLEKEPINIEAKKTGDRRSMEESRRGTTD